MKDCYVEVLLFLQEFEKKRKTGRLEEAILYCTVPRPGQDNIAPKCCGGQSEK
jgi:hypothetical protein